MNQALFSEELCLAIKIVLFVTFWELIKMLFRRARVAVSVATRSTLILLNGANVIDS